VVLFNTKKKGLAQAQVPFELVGREGFEPSTN